ncbi:unnamed protein product [Miscanthus lutarioriparius]|uniref:Wax synthase domain-containing protein n=1 Tax=Miscanthus lutarioriparius TaxID=422564 RepID=A0A811SID3_9POAL|nr:unnamed protein product [Miscanthus lutarioriparius]
MHHSVATVPLAVTAAMLYARFAAFSTRPGLCRLFALIPVLALLLVLPFLIPLYGVRGLVAFFLISKDADVIKTKTVLLSSSIKFAITAVIVHHLHHSKERTHPYAAFVLFGVITYCILDSVLPCLAATGRALGMELEPQFNKPYLSASLEDFWGRRWNLMVSAVLRPSVYNPVRARLGVPAGVLATFLVSGLMHEVMAYYLTFRAPTGQVTAFFVLHGASMCAERWCACRWSARPPRVVATPLVVAFVVSTACWLFLPAIFGGGMDDLYLAEAAALASSFRDVGLSGQGS